MQSICFRMFCFKQLIKFWKYLPPTSRTIRTYFWKHVTIERRFTLKRVRDMIESYSQMHRTDKYSQHSSVTWTVWLNGWVFVYELSSCGFEPCCCHLNFRYRAFLSKEFLDIKATIECRFNLKRVHDIIKSYSQIHRTEKY